MFLDINTTASIIILDPKSQKLMIVWMLTLLQIKLSHTHIVVVCPTDFVTLDLGSPMFEYKLPTTKIVAKLIQTVKAK